MPQTHRAPLLEPWQEGIPQLSTAMLCPALVQPLLQEWDHEHPGPHLSSLPRHLEHDFSQNAVAAFASSLLITLQRKAHSHPCAHERAAAGQRHTAAPSAC